MADRTIIECERCGSIHAARKQGETLVVPTRTGACECGSGTFADLVDRQSESTE